MSLLHNPPMAQDLNNAELDELDQLLADTPEPLQPLDIVMLDGYLCGVLVQPRLIGADEWLPPVFDLDGGSLPDDVDAGWRERVRTLILRRHAALNEQLADEGWFDPIVHDEPELAADSATGDVLRELPGISRPLFSWSAGFQYAATLFPALAEVADEPIVAALDRVFRHLPPETDEDREAARRAAASHPIATLDDAVQDLVLAVAELWERTCDQRFRVEPVRRAEPKVGRNDPCPCGSGKKFKLCHGA